MGDLSPRPLGRERDVNTSFWVLSRRKEDMYWNLVSNGTSDRQTASVFPFLRNTVVMGSIWVLRDSIVHFIYRHHLFSPYITTRSKEIWPTLIQTCLVLFSRIFWGVNLKMFYSRSQVSFNGNANGPFLFNKFFELDRKSFWSVYLKLSLAKSLDSAFFSPIFSVHLMCPYNHKSQNHSRTSQWFSRCLD